MVSMEEVRKAIGKLKVVKVLFSCKKFRNAEVVMEILGY